MRQNNTRNAKNEKENKTITNTQNVYTSYQTWTLINTLKYRNHDGEFHENTRNNKKNEMDILQLKSAVM